MALIILRHTEPKGHAGLCYGRMDLPLVPEFHDTAARIVADLPPVQRVVTSPLSRARLLAEQVAMHRNLPLHVDPRLTEMSFGAWEGRPWSAVPRDELDGWAADLVGYRPPGGETVAEMLARVAAVLEAAEPHTLIVAHAGVAKAAMAWAGAADPWEFRLGFGAWVTLPAPYQS